MVAAKKNSSRVLKGKNHYKSLFLAFSGFSDVQKSPQKREVAQNLNSTKNDLPSAKLSQLYHPEKHAKNKKTSILNPIPVQGKVTTSLKYTQFEKSRKFDFCQKLFQKI